MGKNTSVVLGAAQEAFVKKMIESGRFASASEAMRAGMDALMERDAAVDRWLMSEVVPVYDEMMADPESGHSVESVFDEIREMHRRKKAHAA